MQATERVRNAELLPTFHDTQIYKLHTTYIYLSGVLEKIRLTYISHPQSHFLSCKIYSRLVTHDT